MNSNPEYKKLAHERTVILALVSLAREHLLPLEGDDLPQRQLECEELPRSDSKVPEDSIIDVVVKLQRLARNRELEMSRYAHVLAENNDEQEWSEEEKRESQAGAKGAASPAGKGKAQGGGAHPKSAAAPGGGRKPPHPTNQQAAAAPGKRAQ